MKVFKTMMFSLFVTISIFALSAQSFAAANASNGEALYSNSCHGCHTTEIHTRPDRIIFSKNALIKRIKFCESMAAAHWDEQQFNDVAEYLNSTFYKFDN